MNIVQILDCTLRDGGYCNQWTFGFKNIQKITAGLVESNIDIIECGFLTNRVNYNPDVSRFTSLQQIATVIPDNREGSLFVAMMNYGEYDVDSLPDYDGTSIDGIRVAFHKKDRDEALKLCERIKSRGYKVFVQAMVSLSYSDYEFLDMIRKVNELEPYAFYIVDSFGMMRGKDLTRLFYMVEFNLKQNIWIGFHSHNNMQLAYSNAQTLVSVQTNRNLIIDSSIYGMGRGAGNLNTELFINYLNENQNEKYILKPLLSIIDEILNDFYQTNYWGYSLPNYISASHNAHPNYAGYLDDKKTLTVEAMDEIFSMMDDEKKFVFDKQYIEELYIRYMATEKIHLEHQEKLCATLKGKRILLIAPGQSSTTQKKLIQEAAGDKNTVIISVNFAYTHCNVDYIFLSNLRRFKQLDWRRKEKCIVTSNIPADNVYYQIKYKELLNDVETVKDNAGLMAIKFLLMYDVSEILLAGFDGYSYDAQENYADRHMVFITKRTYLEALNAGMSEVIERYAKQIKISFLTTPRYIKINNT